MIRFVGCVAILLAAIARQASAQDPVAPAVTPAPAPDRPAAIESLAVTTEGVAVEPPTPSESPYHWDRGRARLAVSTRLDLGLIGRAQLHVGYGRPYWIWVGAEVHALTTTEMGALYLGVRASSPVLEISVGYRLNAAYYRGPLGEQEHYSDADLEATEAPSRYRAVDLDLYGIVPLRRVFIPIELAATYLPSAQPRYEEWFRMVATGGWIVAVRAAPLFTFDARRRHRVGVLGEFLFDSGRSATTIRLGPAYQFAITPVVDLYLVGTFAAKSPDSLSTWNDLWGTASLRWRWASGDTDRPHIRDFRRP